jgi:arylformamidase
MDAPFHFSENGATIDQIPLNTLVGPCVVIHLPEIRKISAMDLTNADITQSTQRLLIKTDNSAQWAHGSSTFTKDYVALTPDAADWVVSRSIKLVGIDYLSIGDFMTGTETHRILFEAGIVAVEGLNLSNIEPGNYELICLPINIENAEGAPVRALLRSESRLNKKNSQGNCR